MTQLSSSLNPGVSAGSGGGVGSEKIAGCGGLVPQHVLGGGQGSSPRQGWPSSRVCVMAEDLGIRQKSSVHRPGRLQWFRDAISPGPLFSTLTALAVAAECPQGPCGRRGRVERQRKPPQGPVWTARWPEPTLGSWAAGAAGGRVFQCQSVVEVTSGKKAGFTRVPRRVQGWTALPTGSPELPVPGTVVSGVGCLGNRWGTGPL